MEINELKYRKTIRKYSNRDISEKLLNELFEVACHASTTGNMQLYSVVVTRDVEKKVALSPAHFNQKMVKSAPVILTFCADFNRFIKWCEFRSAKPEYGNFQSFLTALFDTVIFAQQFCTAAESEGLGICYLGTTTYNPDPIIDILKLPKMVIPVLTVTLGYPDENPQMVDRLPLCGIIHNEYYREYSRNDIDNIYKYKEGLPENHKFIEENDKATLAQVFTDVRYTKDNNEFFSKTFLDTLKRQGFNF